MRQQDLAILVKIESDRQIRKSGTRSPEGDGLAVILRSC